ncbi:MAG: AMP-binding protein [Bacteroidales bacterium]|nr:AMP-binding protein [Bacteroidales bacterium]MDD4669629.1 AMP-binding protein [Bacteroidales bacterium]
MNTTYLSQINSLKELFNYSISEFRDNPFISFVNGTQAYTYSEFGEQTRCISDVLSKYGFGKGTKVGIWSQNMPNWDVAYFSIVAFDRVAVPLLPDFSTAEGEHIIEHSEIEVLFISKKIFSKLSEKSKERIRLIISTDDFSVIKEGYQTASSRIEQGLEDLATIIYTSGTTGNSKGVMLSHKNLCTTLRAASDLRPSHEWDIWLSILPLSHTLECSCCLLLPFSAGSSIKYLEKAPTPSVLKSAFSEVRPTTIMSVPLIIEKVYRNSILPQFRKNKFIATIYKSTLGRKILHRIAGVKLMKQFGSRVRFFGIGGAKLDGDVERFLYEARFPYAIGYGLTETSPLLAGAIYDTRTIGSTGPSVLGTTLKIDNPDPETGEGEIVAKGDNVMMGYYKNPEATAASFTHDGWFRTKDLGLFDKRNRLFIKGRMGSMIVGASGENIYPEEIEAVVNSYNLVDASIVTKKNGKLIAIVHISDEAISTFKSLKDNLKENLKQNIQNNNNKIQDKVNLIKDDILEYVNTRVNKYSRLAAIEVLSNDFEKTATQKIKRYLYQ